MTTSRLERAFKAEQSALGPLMAALGDFAAANGIPTGAAFKIELAIDEVVNNAIDHGYPADAPGEVRLTVTRVGNEITIGISDDAPLFDPLGVPVPKIDAPIENRAPRGLGIHLLRSLMTNSSYSVEQGKNHIRLTLSLDDSG